MQVNLKKWYGNKKQEVLLVTIKVLIVDDSTSFQNYLQTIINSDPELEVIGIAINEEEAIEKIARLEPDVITIDVNMPIMNGSATIQKIMDISPVPIIVLSAVTSEGAKLAFDAMEAGALDFVSKDKNFISQDQFHVNTDIIKKIKTVAGCTPKKRKISNKRYEIVLIGASTGGPVALQTIIRELPWDFPLPIVIIQHMPRGFTKPFAERLNSIGNLKVKEAANGDTIFPGNVYIAPGGKQLVFKHFIDDSVKLEVKESDNTLYYHPCVDLSLESANKIFKNKVLALILTGMGTDGKEGVKALKSSGAVIWVQDEKSSVVFGMPAAVLTAGLADRILHLADISKALLAEVT